MQEKLLSQEMDEPRMQALARDLGALLQKGDCLALMGDLGAGKSTFARALIMALTGAVDVPSPTFTLAQYYKSEKGPLTHFDLYRLKIPDDVFELGWEEALQGMVLVEWPERIGSLLPKEALAIALDFPQHQGSRQITLKGNSVWAQRLASLIRRQQH